MIFDAHGHLSDPRLADVTDELITKLRNSGLEHVVLGGVAPSEWERQRELVTQHPEFLTSVLGIHPWTVRETTDADLEQMFTKLESIVDNVPALGEMGVDFYHDNSAVQKNRQSQWCKRQLALASKLNKPVVLHVVKGHDVMQALLTDFKGPCALIHGYRGNQQTAKFYLERGYLLSLGMRSFAKLKPENYAWLPPDGFVIESDAPSEKLVSALVSKSVSIDDVAEEWISGLKGAAEFIALALGLTTDKVWVLARQNMGRFLPTISRQM